MLRLAPQLRAPREQFQPVPQPSLPDAQVAERLRDPGTLVVCRRQLDAAFGTCFCRAEIARVEKYRKQIEAGGHQVCGTVQVSLSIRSSRPQSPSLLRRTAQ